MSAATGGPAFPQLDCDGGVFAIGGMTLRDYFAAKVIQGICASGPGPQIPNEFLTRDAYKIADAMLAERAK